MQKHEWINNAEKTDVLVKDKKFWSHLSEAAYPITKGEMRIPISLEPFTIKKMNRE